MLGELHKAAGRLEGTPVCDRISLFQTLPDVGFLSAVILLVEMVSFDLFSSPKKLYAYFGMDSGVNPARKRVLLLEPLCNRTTRIYKYRCLMEI